MMNYTTEGKTTMPTIPYTISVLNGKAAVFVRGLIEHIDAHPAGVDIPLRPAQKAGMDDVEGLGDTISIPYVSKLTKVLEDADVITKHRKGKGYVLNKDLNFEDMADFLTEATFGMTIERETSDEDIQSRSEFLDNMKEHGAVRISKDRPLAKPAYQLAVEKFKAGEYDMIFIQKDLDIDVWEIAHASVVNQK
jgi:hypothetical protein